MRGDLSKQLAESIAFNDQALGLIEHEGRFIKKKKFVPHEDAAHWLSRVAVSFNTYVLVEDPVAYTLIQDAVEEFMLPITKCFYCPDFDHYSIVRHAFSLEAVLAVGNSELFDNVGEAIRAERPSHGWAMLVDYLDDRRL